MLEFTGAAVVLVGPLHQSGGRAEVFVDGEKSDCVLDAYIVKDTNDNALWHTYGLKPGEHTLRIVTRADADERSQGKSVIIERAILYRPR